MTRAQHAYLSVAKSADVPKLMQEYGFEFAGPSHKDVFMFREPDGRAWLLTDFRGKVAPSRDMLNSFWCEQNLAALMGESAQCKNCRCTTYHGRICPNGNERDIFCHPRFTHTADV
jgi:hypothetical protein